MTAILTLLGALLILVALRDVFDTLFHPSGRGAVSGGLTRLIWRGFRRLAAGRHDVLSLAGPIAFISVIAVWGVLVLVGFALIIWPQLPEGFTFAAGLDPATQDGFAEALYLSLVNLTSLGYGEIAPTADLLRLLGPVETLIGLGLLTASISWILLLHRVLSDYRSLSHEIDLLLDAERASEAGLAGIEPAAAASVLADLTSRVVPMRDDLVHSPIAYYFHPRDERHALPVLLPALIEVAESCAGPDRPAALRFQATMLLAAIDDLLDAVAADFTRSDRRDRRWILDAYRRDHLWAAS